VIILADADSDGLHIATLLAALFLKHFPALVRAGHIFVAMPPLFRVDVGKQVFYALDEEEKRILLERIEKEKIRGQVHVALPVPAAVRVLGQQRQRTEHPPAGGCRDDHRRAQPQPLEQLGRRGVGRMALRAAIGELGDEHRAASASAARRAHRRRPARAVRSTH